MPATTVESVVVETATPAEPASADGTMAEPTGAVGPAVEAVPPPATDAPAASVPPAASLPAVAAVTDPATQPAIPVGTSVQAATVTPATADEATPPARVGIAKTTAVGPAVEAVPAPATDAPAASVPPATSLTAVAAVTDPAIRPATPVETSVQAATVTPATADEATPPARVGIATTTTDVPAIVGDATTIEVPAESLSAAEAPPAGAPTATALTSSLLDPVVVSAKAQWIAAQPTVDFTGVTVAIAELDGLVLAANSGKAITIDATAARWGWTVSGGTMDLPTVVLHELGHMLGLEHAAEGLMEPTLPAGETRRSRRPQRLRARLPPAPRPRAERCQRRCRSRPQNGRSRRPTGSTIRSSSGSPTAPFGDARRRHDD